MIDESFVYGFLFGAFASAWALVSVGVLTDAYWALRDWKRRRNG
jgi:hypothetical protein